MKDIKGEKSRDLKAWGDGVGWFGVTGGREKWKTKLETELRLCLDVSWNAEAGRLFSSDRRFFLQNLSRLSLF